MADKDSGKVIGANIHFTVGVVVGVSFCIVLFVTFQVCRKYKNCISADVESGVVADPIYLKPRV